MVRGRRLGLCLVLTTGRLRLLVVGKIVSVLFCFRSRVSSVDYGLWFVLCVHLRIYILLERAVAHLLRNSVEMAGVNLKMVGDCMSIDCIGSCRPLGE